MILKDRPTRLFIFLGGFFIANALIAEFIGVKIFSLEQSLGIEPLNWSLWGHHNLSLDLSAGVLLWPVVFIMTDIINEYYGRRGVRLLSFLTVGLIAFAFVVFLTGIRLTPSDFWPQSHLDGVVDDTVRESLRAGVGDYNLAFRLVFGQGLWIIVGSLVAFLIGQFLDVLVFHQIKRRTGERLLWLRATGSTLISQGIDSFVVLFIAFYIGAGWSMSLVLAIGAVNYLYKFVMAIALTPAIYMAHLLIDRYLGTERAAELKKASLEESQRLIF